MSNEQGRVYTGTILFKPAAVDTPQVVLDCNAIYSAQTTWIRTYSALPQTINPPPIFYSVPGWQFYLESLQINHFLPSLPPAVPPDIKANSSQPEILTAVNAISRKYKKIELSLLQREGSSGEWHLIGITNLHNYDGVLTPENLKNPWLTQGEVEGFSPTSQLAIRFRTKDDSRKIQMLNLSMDTISIRGWWRSIVTL